MAVGVVAWFDQGKGYGFIKPDDGGTDVFVHVRALARTGLIELRKGQTVRFEVEPAKNGRMAAGRVVLK